MRIYFCDNCKTETEYTEETFNGFQYPKNWITFKGGTIKNDLMNDQGLEYCGGKEMNFCSAGCVTSYFFKRELKERKEEI